MAKSIILNNLLCILVLKMFDLKFEQNSTLKFLNLNDLHITKKGRHSLGSVSNFADSFSNLSVEQTLEIKKLIFKYLQEVLELPVKMNITVVGESRSLVFDLRVPLFREGEVERSFCEQSQ